MLKLGRKMLKNAKKMLKNNKGFTLLELIIVIAIMGFLVAMVAPRLEGIGSSASGTVDDGSMRVASDTLSRYINENNKLPNKVGSLVPSSGTTSGKPLTLTSDTTTGAVNKFIWDGKKSMGKSAIFDASFAEKNKLFVHTLSPAEAEELIGMGIKELVNLEGDVKTVAGGTQVMMIAGGAESMLMTKKIEQKISERVEKTATTSAVPGAKFGDPTLAYRIVVSITDDSELISEGYMKRGAQSAVQGANAKYLQNTNYNIVLPKLKTTFVRTIDMDDSSNKVTKYYATSALQLQKYGANGLATNEKVTIEIVGPDNSNLKDALIMSPTGVVGTGSGGKGYWEVIKDLTPTI